MSGVWIVCAMGVEARAMPSHYRVIESGPGFRCARKAVEDALRLERPRIVVSAGTCGALNPALAIGDVRVVTRIDSTLGVFEPVRLAGEGAVLRSQDRVAATKREKRSLFEAGAQIVDMEAAAVAEVCARLGVPFAAVKAVSDTAAEDLPLDFNLYRDETGQFKNFRIAIAGIMKISELMRLQKNAKLAAQQLGAAIDASLANII